MKKGLPIPTVPLFQVSSSRFFLFHSLNDFQSCEFFPFFFFQCIGDIVNQFRIHWNGDILQRICPLLCLFNVSGKAICCVFHHGKFYRQIFYFSECICSQVYALAGCTESVGRRRHGRGVFYVGNLGSHNTSGLNGDGVFNRNGIGNLRDHVDTMLDIGTLQALIRIGKGAVDLGAES